MPSRHESITLALLTALAGHSATVLRERELPEFCPDEGVINLVPEDPVELDQRLGDAKREFSRGYDLEVVVQDADEVARAARLDSALTQIAQLLDGSNLGGAVDFLRLEAPQETEDVPMEGAASLKAAVMPLTVFYETSDNPME